MVANETNRPWSDQVEQREKTLMVSVRLPVSVVDGLDRIAARDNSTRAAVMRYPLKQFVDAESDTPPADTKTDELFP